MEATALQTNIRAQFEENGFVGPLSVLDEQQCRDLANALRGPGKSIAWPKGRAPVSRLLFELATDRTILDVLEELAGPDIVLYAASIVTRQPGQIHPWHTDIETAHSNGNAISVWIGLENTNANSSLQVVSRSHALGRTIQEVAGAGGVAREDVSVDEVVGWAQQRDSGCEFVNVAMTDGMAVVFDGRLWHGSDNTNTRGTRTAVLLQYATPDFSVRIPDPSTLTWPFAYYQVPKPPCIMVRGSTDRTENDFVAPPDRADAKGTLITKLVRQLNLPLARDPEEGRRAHPMFSGRTRVHDEIASHISVLESGQTPHPPHEHREEEILIMLDGEADLISVPERDGVQVRRRVGRGDFAYYPGGFLHTITNPSAAPATYLMFKWSGRDAVSEGMLPGTYVSASEAASNAGSAFEIEKVMEGPTRFLRRLHSHTSVLAPGGGYDAHVDAHDVAIILLEGSIRTMGEELHDNGLVYFSAGEPHDMLNVGDTPARYVVFEFHTEGRLTDMGWTYNVKRTVGSLKKIAKRMGAKKVVDALRSMRR